MKKNFFMASLLSLLAVLAAHYIQEIVFNILPLKTNETASRFFWYTIVLMVVFFGLLYFLNCKFAAWFMNRTNFQSEFVKSLAKIETITVSVLYFIMCLTFFIISGGYEPYINWSAAWFFTLLPDNNIADLNRVYSFIAMLIYTGIVPFVIYFARVHGAQSAIKIKERQSAELHKHLEQNKK